MTRDFVGKVGPQLLLEATRAGWEDLASGTRTGIAARLATLEEARAAIWSDPGNPLEVRWEALANMPHGSLPSASRFLAMIDETLAGEKPYESFPSRDLTRAVPAMQLAGANPAVKAWLEANPASAGEEPWQSKAREFVYMLVDSRQEGAADAAIAVLRDFPGSSIGGPDCGAFDADMRAVVHAAADRPDLIAALDVVLRTRPENSLVNIASSLQSEALVDALGGLVEMSFERLIELTRTDNASGGYYDRIVQMQRSAASALRRFPGNARANEALRRGMLQGSQSLRDTCAGVLESHAAFLELERSGGQVETVVGAKARLFAMLKGQDPALAAEAARGLATIGAVEALPDLIEALAHPDPGVRAAVRESIDRLNAQEPRRQDPPAGNGSPASDG